MKAFRFRVEVASSFEGCFASLDALVDPGAFYSWIPREALERLGVVPHSRRNFVYADGSVGERDVGRAWLRIGESEEPTLVVFGDAASPAVIGTHTLEAFGLAADVEKRSLEPIPALPMLFYSNHLNGHHEQNGYHA